MPRIAVVWFTITALTDYNESTSVLHWSTGPTVYQNPFICMHAYKLPSDCVHSNEPGTTV